MTKEKQFKFDKKYLRMAKIWAENSYAERRKVGCLIVKDNMIISDGYNGTPSGFENDCEYTRYIDLDRCVLCTQEHCDGCNNIETIIEDYLKERGI